jgi:hypothetical protein
MNPNLNQQQILNSIFPASPTRNQNPSPNLMNGNLNGPQSYYNQPNPTNMAMPLPNANFNNGFNQQQPNNLNQPILPSFNGAPLIPNNMPNLMNTPNSFNDFFRQNPPPGFVQAPNPNNPSFNLVSAAGPVNIGP